MIGSEDRPSLSAKAAESHGLLKFIDWLFAKHLPRFDGLDADMKRKARFIKQAVGAALELDSVFQSESRKLTRAELQKAFCAYSRFLSFYQKAGGPHTPKCHSMIHLIQRAKFKGNPRLYSTYRDESFNGMIAKIARSCHRRTWSNAVHWKCHALHKKGHDRVIKSGIFSRCK